MKIYEKVEKIALTFQKYSAKSLELTFKRNRTGALARKGRESTLRNPKASGRAKVNHKSHLYGRLFRRFRYGAQQTNLAEMRS